LKPTKQCKTNARLDFKRLRKNRRASGRATTTSPETNPRIGANLGTAFAGTTVGRNRYGVVTGVTLPHATPCRHPIAGNMPGMAGIADMGRHFVSTTGACLRGLAERLQRTAGPLRRLFWRRHSRIARRTFAGAGVATTPPHFQQAGVAICPVKRSDDRGHGLDPSEARLIRDEIIAAEATDLRAPAAGSASMLPSVADRLRSGTSERGHYDSAGSSFVAPAQSLRRTGPAPSDIPLITVA
jgi:hypothetical protein